MATDQSVLQSFIQNQAGTQTTAQTAQPTTVNNGNPNTAYNWATYLPQFTGGQNPTANFNLLTAQAPASSPGYTPPFAADPYAAAVVSQIPQATGNENVNRILGNLFGGTNPWTNTIGQPGTGTPPGTTPPPGGTPPPAPPGYTPPPGAGLPGRPVGPISGAIDEWIRGGPGTSPPDTTAPTNLFDNQQGRQYVLDWLRQGNGANFESVADFLDDIGGIEGLRATATNEQGTGWWDNVQNFFSGLVDEAQQMIGNLSWQQVLDMAADLIGVPGDWYNSQTGEWNNPAEALGLNGIIGFIQDNFGSGDEPVTEEQLAQLMEEVNNAQADTIAQQMAEATDLIQRHLDEYQVPFDNGQTLEDWYNSQEEWTPQEWQDMQETMAWNNFWYGDDQAADYNASYWGRQPTIGLPALDNVDVFLNQMNRNALGVSEWFRNMRGRLQQ